MDYRYTNRLANETSPYLLQHAHNPVDWYAWGTEALDRAKVENKPILVSIGYAACHWCHVMERESFENPETAALMNQYFINIKIDREERPDIDAIYMDAVQLISGSGGWPLNVFLTPEAKPFYGGTYFPPVRAYSRSSWPEILLGISRAWAEKPNELIAQAENLTEHIRGTSLFESTSSNGSPGETEEAGLLFGKEEAAAVRDALLSAADKVSGGFGRAPKFPQSMSIVYLLRSYYFTSDSAALDHALLSLDKMIYGGIYDQLDGGFARYSTDNEWLAPHFEKMLYDNALLISTMAEAYQVTGKELYRQTISRTLSFIFREWRAPEGGFYSAYDADSEGVEGKYYTWSQEEIQRVLGNDAQLFSDFYGVSTEGNWEHTNILCINEPLDAYCERLRLDFTETAAILEQCRLQLLAHRNSRIRPLLDDKILFGWNALMITALCKSSAALRDSTYLKIAEQACQFIEDHLRGIDDRYYHNYKNGPANPAFLDDLACYIEALINLAEVTGNNTYFSRAASITEHVLEHFSDPASDLFYFTPRWQPDVIIRKKEWYDGATPSGNSTMATNLHYLSVIFENAVWAKRSRDMIAAVAANITKYPTSFSRWAALLQQLRYETWEIVVSGESAGSLHQDIIAGYLPNRVLQCQFNSEENFALLKNRWQNGRNNIYVCKNYECQAPVRDVSSFWKLLAKTV